MTTLAEHIIVAGAENRPPMLEKSMYDSWASIIRLFIKGKKNGRMMLDLINEGPLVYPTVVGEDGQPRPKKYSELTKAQNFKMTVMFKQQISFFTVFHPMCMHLSTIKRQLRIFRIDKFITDVKLAKSLHTTNYDQLYAYLSQHERHANKVRIMRERYPDPLALVANSQNLYNPSQSPQHSGEDPIDCINKAMAFLLAMASRFLPSNNQLKTSSNPINQATIQDGRVTVQQVQGRPRSSAWFKEKLMLVEDQEAGQILDEEQLAFIADPGIDSSWFNEEQLAFIADPRIAEVQVAQQRIPQNSAFQTEDLDAYDSDCDDISSTKAVLMENLSSCDLDVLFEVPYSDTYPNDMINQDVQKMLYSEQTHTIDFPNNEITSDSNIIPYSQYLQESQDVVIQDTNSSAPNDLLVLSLVEQMTDHVANLDKKNQTNKMLNKIKEDFGKRFITQKELSAEQAFWLKHSNYNLDTSVKSHIPVRIEDPSELPKVSLVNESLKKLKYHLASFDKVVKKRITSDAITAAAVDQCSVDKNDLEIKIKQLSIDNDQLLNQIMSQEIMHIAVNSVDILDINKSCVDECNKCLELETELFKKKDFIEKDVYDKLVKTQSQEKNTVIRKLKDRIKSLIGKESVEKVKKDIDETETINIELEHSVAKLLSENENLRKEREHLKSIFKDQFNSIKKTRVQSKEHCDSLIAQINAKSVENLDLNVKLQEKVFAIAALKNELRKLKGKNVVDAIASKPTDKLDAVTPLNKDKKVRFAERVTS
ncbi:hypothetical protein Tco_1298713, partial [Tanacetum coccineum]